MGEQYNVALRMKYEQTCLDCGDSDFVEDHASGDLICRVSLLPLHSTPAMCFIRLILTSFSSFCRVVAV